MSGYASAFSICVPLSVRTTSVDVACWDIWVLRRPETLARIDEVTYLLLYDVFLEKGAVFC